MFKLINRKLSKYEQDIWQFQMNKIMCRKANSFFDLEYPIFHVLTYFVKVILDRIPVENKYFSLNIKNVNFCCMQGIIVSE